MAAFPLFLAVEMAKKTVSHTVYLVLWWVDKAPLIAQFEDEFEAVAFAAMRNAVVIEVTGKDQRVETVVDYYRRDDNGKPITAKWIDPHGNRPIGRL